MLTIESLIGKGYFPQEAIPPLTSKGLIKYLPIILPQIEIFCRPIPTKTSKCEEFTIPKIKNSRRIISIPNPLHQIRLSQTISSNWINIKNHTDKSHISASRLNISDPVFGNRSFERIDFHDIKHKLNLITTSRYLLKFDIARFYSSIYTHSIPWALHTKPVSKAKRKRNDLFGNAIDEDLRATQDGQTNGIPIGPDTSRVISEIIGSSIDEVLQNNIRNVKGIRYVDDFLLYFKTYSEVEETISIIQGALSDFHLEPNQSKFSITELPEPFGDIWTITLSRFTFRSSSSEQEADIINFFNLAFSLSKSEPNSYVLPYAISRFQTIIVHPKTWPTLESLLLHIFYIEPKTIRYVCNILLSYKKKGFSVNAEKIEECINDFIVSNSQLRNHHEISWACWLAKEMNIRVYGTTATYISRISSSSVALAAMSLNSAGLIDGSLDITLWDSIVKQDNLYNENWLLVYESVKKGWVSRKSNFFDKDPFFKILFDNNVSFYEEAKPLAAKQIKIEIREEYWDAPF